MSIRYYKLFDLLNRKGMKKTDLRKILSSSTVAKLSKGQYISGDAIEKICRFLECQPGDIMEYIPDEPKKTVTQKVKEVTVDPFMKGYKLEKDAPTAMEGFKNVGKEIKTTLEEAAKKK